MVDANKTVVDGESRLNDDEMKASSLSFLAAGYDTTTTTVVCAGYFLATNEDVQEKLVQEIKSAREKNQGTNYEFVHSVEYLDWFLKEVLRLCPPGHRHMRQCEEECVINGLKFPKGVRVHILTYAIHHDPDVWPDPFKFDPERFSPEEEAKRHPFSYLPFGAGPRQCIGNRYAMMVMKIILVRVLEAGYRFKRSADTKLLVLKSFNQLRPVSPIYLRFELEKQ
jgi:cytochrome P450